MLMLLLATNTRSHVGAKHKDLASMISCEFLRNQSLSWHLTQHKSILMTSRQIVFVFLCPGNYVAIGVSRSPGNTTDDTAYTYCHVRGLMRGMLDYQISRQLQTTPESSEMKTARAGAKH